MQPRNTSKRTSRRKIALACEPCRERKSRCDGHKPICGPCERRSYTIERCVYNADNARSASNDEYIRALHHRIRELEDVCVKAGVGVPGNATATATATANANAREDITPSRPIDRVHDARTDPASNVTAMGAISVAEDGDKVPSPENDYFGSSSTVSLMRLARRSITTRSNREETLLNPDLRPHTHPEAQESISSIIHDICSPSPRFTFNDFSLPPRALADHLLDCFWEHVYCLYPFFHRPSFEQAYDSIWASLKEPRQSLTRLHIGLGSQIDSGSRSIVFHCALNSIFALGCHFAEIPLREREAISLSFFDRAKQFVGLDLVDLRTIGVVQALLIIAIFLQSTPYPNRCWNAIGLACRVAQGLGLHEATVDESLDPLEREIRRRTWHGCVMMDMTVSMTYGRPSMTSHLARVPLPGDLELASPLSDQHDPSLITFYVCTIELYRILDSILSDVYNAWRGRSDQHPEGQPWMKQGGLDVIIELEGRLSGYEASLPAFLSWRNPSHSHAPTASILERQRNVLHARFLHLRLLLYRPIFTQLCSEKLATPRSGTQNEPSDLDISSILYSSIAAKCAATCVTAAVELISLVYQTYKSSTTDAWWYNGFYTSTAGMVLVMSYSCRPILEELDSTRVEATWRKCEHVLMDMAAFSLSARNTLRFLQAAYSQVSPSVSRNEAATTATATATATGDADDDMLSQILPFGTSLNWDDAVAGMAPDELGFLGRFDFADVPAWMDGA